MPNIDEGKIIGQGDVDMVCLKKIVEEKILKNLIKKYSKQSSEKGCQNNQAALFLITTIL